MPYSEEEQAKRAQNRQEIQDKVDKLVAKGASVTDALKLAGVSKSVYYYDSTKRAARERNEKTQAKRLYKKRAKLTVTELPVLTPKAPASFLLFGPPAILAEFVRAYE